MNIDNLKVGDHVTFYPIRNDHTIHWPATVNGFTKAGRVRLIGQNRMGPFKVTIKSTAIMQQEELPL